MEANKSNVIAKSLSAVFIHIKEMPIKLNEILYFNMYGKLKILLLMIAQNYQEAFDSKRLGIIARMIFGSIVDVKDMGIGLNNFKNGKPNEIVSSTGNLMKNTVTGAFGTVSEVTSTVSQGLLALSTDEEYIKERQRDEEKYKPQNIIEGVGYGLMATVKSIGSGLAGIVTKPIEGASKEGVKGFAIVKFYINL